MNNYNILSTTCATILVASCQSPDKISPGEWEINNYYGSVSSPSMNFVCIADRDIEAYRGKGFYGFLMDDRCETLKMSIKNGEIDIKQDCRNVDYSKDPVWRDVKGQRGWIVAVRGEFDEKRFKYSVFHDEKVFFAIEGVLHSENVDKCIKDKSSENIEREFRESIGKAGKLSRDYERALRGDFSK